MVPNTWQVGSLAILFDKGYNSTTTSVTNVLPSGWTDVANTANNSAGTGRTAVNVSYKILTSGDLGATITGINAATNNDKVLVNLTYGSNIRIPSITVNSSRKVTPVDTDPGGITGSVTQQSWSHVLAMFGSSGAVSSRIFRDFPSGSDNSQNEISSSTRMYVKTARSDNFTSSTAFFDTSDVGNKNFTIQIEVTGNSDLLRSTTATTSKSTDTSRTTTYGTTTTFNTTYDTTGSTSRATSTSINLTVVLQ